MRRGYAAIGLDNPKTPENIGGVLRACGCYGASLVVLGGPRPERLANLKTDTQKAWRHIPHILVGDVFDALPFGCVPVAVDLLEGAIPLPRYVHPERAFYIFGAEDRTLGREITGRCRESIVVPTAYCMNLAATVNVVLYDRMAKEMGNERRNKATRRPVEAKGSERHNPLQNTPARSLICGHDDRRHLLEPALCVLGADS